MTPHDERVRYPRLSAFRGAALIVFGVVVLWVSADRHDDHSWQGLVLAGASFAVGALMLVRGLRNYPKDRP